MIAQHFLFINDVVLWLLCFHHTLRCLNNCTLATKSLIVFLNFSCRLFNGERGMICFICASSTLLVGYCEHYGVHLFKLTSLLCCHNHWIAKWSLLYSFSRNGELILVVCMERTNNKFITISSLHVISQKACAGLILPNMVIPYHSILLVNSWRNPSQEHSSGI